LKWYLANIGSFVSLLQVFHYEGPLGAGTPRVHQLKPVANV
jgi:hypothetical protein